MSKFLLVRFEAVVFMILSLVGLDSASALAQTGNNEARAFIAKVQDAYKQAAYLGFKLRYQYANAGSPTSPIDTIAGEVQMDKARCRFVLDGTETLVTDKYIIQVMPEEKAMYLSGVKNASKVNPVKLLDTVFTQMEGVRTTISTENRSSVLTMDFPAGGMYSRIRMEVEPVTGYFKRIIYYLYTKTLVGTEMIERPGHPGLYAPEGTVEMIFSEYERGRFGDDVFDDRKFFTRSAGKVELTGRFQDYHIFLADSNL
jgi:hypothetical protein